MSEAVSARVSAAPDPAAGIDTLAARPSVIVMPFANTSGNEANDYLAFGMTDELITGLQPDTLATLATSLSLRG